MVTGSVVTQGAATPARTTGWGTLGVAALCAVPGGLTIYLAFNGGGYFPGQPAIVALVLALLLVVWTTMSEHPFRGMSFLLGLAAGALALFAIWSLASQGWSHAPGRALVEFDRALLYAVAMIFVGSVVTSARRLRWMTRGIAAAIGVVCVCGLATWLFPDVFHVGPNVGSNRLSFPITYWNVLGLLAAFGIILCFHLAADRREPRLVRLFSAAFLPLLATTLYFTFSRGAIGVAIIGLVVYCALARSRLLAWPVLAALPPTVAVVLVAYHADRLASSDPTTRLAAAQGHRVAVVAVIAMLAAGLVQALLLRFEPKVVAYTPSPRVLLGARASALGLAVIVLVLAAALGVPQAVARQYDRFIGGPAPGQSGDLRTRLLDPSNDGRTDGWRVALRGFRDARGNGQGAGTYQVYWERHRPTASPIRNAHSLYFQVAGELGVVGVVLLAIALAAILVGVLRRARGPDRGIAAAVFAVVLAWCIHAAVEWDWEMPVVTALALMLAGAVLSTRKVRSDPPEEAPKSTPRAVTRLTVAVGWLAVAIAPALVTISDGQIARAAGALEADDCRTARDAAFSSIAAVGTRSQPYEIAGYCDLAAGSATRARLAMKEAIRRDPNNWQYYDGLAVADAAAGLDPRPAARQAVARDPREPLAQQVQRRFDTTPRSRWEATARTAREWMIDSGRVGSR